MKIELKNPLCQVSDGKRKTYGGSQTLSESSCIKEVGCGVVAAQELLLYLCRYRGGQGSDHVRVLAAKQEITPKDYDECTGDLRKNYFPLIPKLGITGISLAFGLNKYFRVNSMPFKADWEIAESGFAGGIEQQLAEDIPVIMSVGPNFPKIWGKNNLQLYLKNPAGEYYPSPKERVLGHYVLVAAIDGEWMRISSWGRKYYINIAEYKDYVARYSSSLVSNYVRIRTR